MKLVASLLGVSLAWSAIGTVALASPAPDPFPEVATYREFSTREFSLGTVSLVEKGYEGHRAAILRAGGKQLASTDEGYGPKYRARFVLKDGDITVYSGVFDGWRTDWRFKPRPLREAITLARTYHARTGAGALKVDFDHPSHPDRSTVTCASTEDGCQATYSFELDQAGRCVGITYAGAC
jgi:hypothetical protein